MSKIGIVIGVSSAHSLVLELDLESISICSGKVVDFRGEPLGAKVDVDSTEDSIDVGLVSVEPSMGDEDPML